MPKLYIKRYKWAMLLSMLIFAVGLFLGIANAQFLHNVVANEVDKLRQVSQGLSESGNPELSFFTFIVWNNVIKSVLVIWLGLAFGILPVLFLLLNGLAIGFVVENNAQSGANVAELIVKGLLPHGIIELPALLIACAYGLQLGGLVWNALFRPAGKRAGAEKWKEILKAAVGATVWITVLLILAALIESTVTYHLVRN